MKNLNPIRTRQSDYLQEKLLKIGGNAATFLGSMILGFAIMVIGLYFFLVDGPKMIESFKGLSPLDDDHEQEIVSEFGLVSRAVVVATLLSALVQGLLAGIGFYFAGLDSIFLLTVLSGVLAMVPFVGAAAVWIPCCLYLYFVDDNLTAAIGLAIYGTLVISMADNVIKPLVLHGQSNIHPTAGAVERAGRSRHPGANWYFGGPDGRSVPADPAQNPATGNDSIRIGRKPESTGSKQDRLTASYCNYWVKHARIVLANVKIRIIMGKPVAGGEIPNDCSYHGGLTEPG